MKLLLTGGSGYIGSHAAIEFSKKGHELFLLDNFSNSDPSVLNKLSKILGYDLPFFNVDIGDADRIFEIIKSNDIEGVIHFAGLKSVSDSVANPISYFDNNVVGTIGLLKAMKKTNASYFIFSSSATVYGEPNELPLKETHELLPTNPYGESKLHIEKILSSVCGANAGFKCVCLRYFNPAGAHSSSLIGENPKGTPNNLFPYISQVAEGSRENLNIFGSDYSTQDGTGVRDYIHIEDLVEGHLSALDFLNSSPKKNYHVFNLGSGIGYSVRQIVRTYEEVNKIKIPVKYVDRRDGDIAENYADPSLANNILKWKTKRTLEDICKSIHNFQMNR